MKRWAAAVALAAAGCGTRDPGGDPPQTPPAFASLAEDFVYQSLALSPVAATGAGYHVHNGVRLDEQLDDYSAAGVERARRFYASFRDRIAAIRPESLTPDDRADFDIVSDQVALGLLELDEIQNYRHNPTVYVELIGNALFSPWVLEYAPKPERVRHIIARLEKVPALVEQA
ncbi:MAG: DUF885 family protein, partial [Bryobacteraceae bacterium]